MPELFPYQKTGVEFLSKRNLALLADEPGLGKTAQAIVAADEVNAQRVLVICPAVAKENWRREFQRWQTRTREISVQYGTVPLLGAKVDVYIVNYDLLTNAEIMQAIKSRTYNLMILDEAHYLKSSGAKRTIAVYGDGAANDGLLGYAFRTWALTGTPAPNHAGEMFTHLRALYPKVLEDNGLTWERDFQDHFCEVRETVYGRQIIGNKNLKELAAWLRPVMLRRKKKDVLPDLPPLNFVAEPLSDLRPVITPEIDKIIAGCADDDDILPALRAADIHLATERRLTGTMKVEGAADLIADMLKDNWRKIVVFAVHKQVIDELADRTLSFNSVTVDGRTTPKDRQAAVDKFQTDPDCRVFIGNVQAAGTAITLTASSDVLFVETSWVPSENFQAACRCHRIGQKDGVLARMLFIPGSIDETVQRVLARKAKDLAELFG